MESFYGGRQGASLAIKASFQYLSDSKKTAIPGENQSEEYLDPYYGQALNALIGQPDPDPAKEGAPIETLDRAAEILAPQVMRVQFDNHEYKDVWYGEYCIIDTKNKNNKNNGKIYRRTLKQAQVDDERWIGGVAEYIGQIVGPAGPSPILKEIQSVDVTEQQFDNETLSLDDTIYFKDKNGVFKKAKVESNENLYINKLISGDNFIRGDNQEKYTENKQYIQHGAYNWYTIKKYLADDEEERTEIYLGFDVPYYYTEFNAGKSINYAESPVLRPTINVSKDDIIAPFYEKYEIDIPRGITGAYYTNIRIEKTDAESATKYVISPDKIQYNGTTDTYFVKDNDKKVGDGKEYWVADFHWIKPPTELQNNDTSNEQDSTETQATSNEDSLNTEWNFNEIIPNVILCERTDVWITKIYRTTASDEGKYFYIPAEGEDKTPVEMNHLLLQVNNFEHFKTNLMPTVQEEDGQGQVVGQWIDLGCIQNVLNGLYVNGANIEVKHFTDAVPPQSMVELANDALNSAADIDPTLKEKAVPVTIQHMHKENGEDVIDSSEVVVFYYDAEDHSWKELGRLSSSGQGKGVLIFDDNDQEISGNVINLYREAIISSSILSTPWRL